MTSRLTVKLMYQTIFINQIKLFVYLLICSIICVVVYAIVYTIICSIIHPLYECNLII